MTIEFMNGETLEVKQVFGGARLIDGIKRDVLRIEVSPTIEKEELERLFKDNPNAFRIYSYVSREESPTIAKRVIMAEGYTIFIGVTSEKKIIPHRPGLLLPDKSEFVNVVSIAQMTYEEYESSKNQEG